MQGKKIGFIILLNKIYSINFPKLIVNKIFNIKIHNLHILKLKNQTDQ